MTGAGTDLRDLVSSVVREMLGDLVGEAVRDQVRGSAPSAPAPPESPPAHSPAPIGADHVTSSVPRVRTEAVRIDTDADLDRFARHLLALFDNPKNRQDLRAGRLRFELVNPAGATAPAGQAMRIDRGAVTERHVKEAADAGRRLILGRRAVITPLGREKARALDVPIEKER